MTLVTFENFNFLNLNGQVNIAIIFIVFSVYQVLITIFDYWDKLNVYLPFLTAF